MCEPHVVETKTQLFTPLSLGFHQRQSEAFQKAPDTGFD